MYKTFFYAPRRILRTALLLTLVVLSQLTLAESGDSCLVKKELILGKKCGHADSVELRAEQTCGGKLDGLFCLEKTSGEWDCGGHLNMSTGMLGGYYVCSGTGKYKMWARSSDSNVPFPNPKGSFRSDGKSVYAYGVGDSREQACARAKDTATSSAGCQCEAYDQKGNFHCRILLDDAQGAQAGKVSDFSKSQFPDASTVQADVEEKFARLKWGTVQAYGRDHDAACAAVRHVVEDDEAPCDCAAKGKGMLCHITYKDLPPEDPSLRRLLKSAICDKDKTGACRMPYRRYVSIGVRG